MENHVINCLPSSLQLLEVHHYVQPLLENVVNRQTQRFNAITDIGILINLNPAIMIHQRQYQTNVMTVNLAVSAAKLEKEHLKIMGLAIQI